MSKERNQAIKLIEDYFSWKKISKHQAMDIFDLIHLSHKGKSWKSWIWDKLVDENPSFDDVQQYAGDLELVIRLFNIQVEEIKGFSRISIGGLAN